MPAGLSSPPRGLASCHIQTNYRPDAAVAQAPAAWRPAEERGPPTTTTKTTTTPTPTTTTLTTTTATTILFQLGLALATATTKTNNDDDDDDDRRVAGGMAWATRAVANVHDSTENPLAAPNPGSTAKLRMLLQIGREPG
jgi:hypothetical protein